MSILFDDDYHTQAYDVCRQMHFRDGLSYGDVLQAHGLDRGLIRYDASLNTLAIRIADVFRTDAAFGWCDQDTIQDYVKFDGKVIRLDDKRQEMSTHTCPNEVRK